MGSSMATPEMGRTTFADVEIQSRCDAVKGQAQEKTGQTYDTFQAKTYKMQTLGHGTSYYVTVHVGGNKHVDIFVLKLVSEELVLQSVQEF